MGEVQAPLARVCLARALGAAQLTEAAVGEASQLMELVAGGLLRVGQL